VVSAVGGAASMCSVWPEFAEKMSVKALTAWPAWTVTSPLFTREPTMWPSTAAEPMS